MSINMCLSNEELLIEILIRLPLKYLFQTKCVSKKWNTLTSTLYFRSHYVTHCRNSPSPLLGFFQSYTEIRKNPSNYEPVPRLSYLSTSKQEDIDIKSRTFDNLGLLVSGASNGYILCGWHGKNCFIYSPLTKKLFPLPIPNMKCYGLAIGFSCESQHGENDFVRFKVIRVSTNAHEPIKNTIRIETFSSETGKWEKSVLTAPVNFLIDHNRNCSVVEGTFFWDAKKDNFAAYDPNVEPNSLWLIKWPGSPPRAMCRALGKSSNGLLTCVFGDRYGFDIWVLRKKLSSYSFSREIQGEEWVLSITVNYREISDKFRRLISFPQTGYNGWADQGFLENFLIAFHPQNSAVVYFRFRHKIVSYNVETGRLELVHYQGTAYPSSQYELFPYFQPDWPLSLPPNSVSSVY